MQTTSPARQQKLQNLLTASDVALHWRNNTWNVLGRKAAQQRELPKTLHKTVESMIANGHLIAGDDGAFRLSKTTPAPLVRADESPFQRLINKRESNGKSYFDAEQIRAGEKLRTHYERGNLSARVTANYQARSGGFDHHEKSSDNMLARMSEDTLAARQAVHAALNAVGPELSSMLLKVCCLDSGFEDAERQLNLPRRAGKAVLAMALTRLARHYHFKPRQRHSGPDKIGHWAIEDFRPAIQPLANSGHLA